MSAGSGDPRQTTAAELAADEVRASGELEDADRWRVTDQETAAFHALFDALGTSSGGPVLVEPDDLRCLLSAVQRMRCS